MQPKLDFDTEMDLPPEYCHYQDEGCEFSQTCLNCSLPVCVYDEPRGRQRWLKSQRDSELVRLFEKEGKRAPELATMFGISRRTVQRALKNSLRAPPPYQDEWPDDLLERTEK